MNRFKSQLQCFHVLKDVKPQARSALHTTARDDLINVSVERTINALNGNHKLTKDEKRKLVKYKNRFRAMVTQRLVLKENVNFQFRKEGFSPTAHQDHVRCNRITN